MDQSRRSRASTSRCSAGEVFGLLGPNGAGKTTTVEILEGLRPRSGGEVQVLGFDPDRQKQALKDRIGVCLQATNLPGQDQGARSARTLWFLLFEAGRWRRAPAPVAALGKTRGRLRHTFRRTEAAPRACARADQRSANAFSRRTDDRARSAGAPRDSRPDRGAARRKAHDSDDHALHRGSGAPLRSRRDHR